MRAYVCAAALDGAFIFFCTRTDAHDAIFKQTSTNHFRRRPCRCARRAKERFNHGVNRVVIDSDVDLNLEGSRRHIPRAVELRMAALTTENPLKLRNSEAVNAGTAEGPRGRRRNLRRAR